MDDQERLLAALDPVALVLEDLLNLAVDARLRKCLSQTYLAFCGLGGGDGRLALVVHQLGLVPGLGRLRVEQFLLRDDPPLHPLASWSTISFSRLTVVSYESADFAAASALVLAASYSMNACSSSSSATT